MGASTACPHCGSDPLVFDMDAAATHMGITPNTLRAYRFKRYPPDHPTAPFPEPFMRVGNGRVPLWTIEQLDEWNAARAVPDDVIG